MVNGIPSANDECKIRLRCFNSSIYDFLRANKTITTDCGTNFTSKLTQELLKRLKCCPRFTSPAHPEANGLVERCNGSIKSMVYKLAQDDPNGWHKLLQYVLWD